MLETTINKFSDNAERTPQERDPFYVAIVERMAQHAACEGLRMGTLFAEDLATEEGAWPIESARNEINKMLDSHDLDLLVLVGSEDDGTYFNDVVFDYMTSLRGLILDESRLIAFASLSEWGEAPYVEQYTVVPHFSSGRSIWLVVCDGMGDSMYDRGQYPLIAFFDHEHRCLREFAPEGLKGVELRTWKENFIADMIWEQKAVGDFSVRIDCEALLYEDRIMRLPGGPFLNQDAMERYGLSTEEVEARMNMNYSERSKASQELFECVCITARGKLGL